MTSHSAPLFTFYYRENCHLCESMRLALLKLQRSLDFNWEEIDIDRDTELIRRFDWMVPVLHCQDEEVCHHFIDEDAIRRHLQGQNHE